MPVHNTAGEMVDSIEISDEVFGEPFREPLVHQAVVRQMANARKGTHDTKTRGEVSGGGRKPFRQKGTGRARQGSVRSPQFRGGGVVFGPHPRSYKQAMPVKMRRLAMRCVLSAKVTEGHIRVLDRWGLEVPRTKEMITILERLGIDGSVLILTTVEDLWVQESARNLPQAWVTRVETANVVRVLSGEYLVTTVSGLRWLEDILNPGRVDERRLAALMS